jgi:hypothetical protein
MFKEGGLEAGQNVFEFWEKSFPLREKDDDFDVFSRGCLLLFLVSHSTRDNICNK